MGLTIAEKLISAALVEGKMERGRRIGIRADQTLSHDLNGVMSYQVLQAVGLEDLDSIKAGGRLNEVKNRNRKGA